MAIIDYWDFGDSVVDYADNCLENLLKDFSIRYPSCSIQGYIGYYYIDCRGGESKQNTISFPSQEKEYEGEDIIISQTIGQKLSELLKYNVFCNTLSESEELKDLQII